MNKTILQKVRCQIVLERYSNFAYRKLSTKYHDSNKSGYQTKNLIIASQNNKLQKPNKAQKATESILGFMTACFRTHK